MAQTFTHKPPVTQGINNLADTIGAMLDARNQRMAMEQKAKMDAIKEGYDTLNKTTTILSNRDLHPSLKKSALEQYNSKIRELGSYGVNIQPLPTDIDFNDTGFNTVVKQIKAAPKALESGSMSFSELPAYLNNVTQDFASGANDKDRAFIEKISKDLQKDEANKEFGTLANVISKPESMGNTPEEQNSIVQQMVGHLRAGDPQAATDLWKMHIDSQKELQKKDYKITGAAVYRMRDGTELVKNPKGGSKGEPAWLTVGENGEYVPYRKQVNMNEVQKNTVLPTPTPIITKADLLKSARQRLQNIAEFYDPAYVGWLQNMRVGEGQMSMQEFERRTKDLPPKQVAFLREVKNLNDDIVRAKEGAVVPLPMLNKMEQFLVDLRLTPKNFESNYENFTNYTKDQMRNTERSIWSQYVSPFGEEDVNWYKSKKPSIRGGRGAGAIPGNTQQLTIKDLGVAGPQLLEAAKSGDKQAQMYLQSKGIKWQP